MNDYNISKARRKWGASAYVTTSHTLAGKSQFLTFFYLNHHKTTQERPILTNLASNDAQLHAEYNSVSCVAELLKFAEIVGKMPKNRKSIITQQMTNQMEWDKNRWTPDYIFYLAGITPQLWRAMHAVRQGCTPWFHLYMWMFSDQVIFICCHFSFIRQ